MRVVVVADVHANLSALEAVLDAASRHGAVDAIWSLGDVVGYGPEPSACIELLRSRTHVAIAGNHDLAAAGEIDTAEFNRMAAAAIEWTAAQLSDDEKQWLRSLPRVAVEGEFTLVHGSLADPVWEYLVDPTAAEAHFALQQTAYALVGHSHLPLAFQARGVASDAGRTLRDGDSLSLEVGRFVANPGSAGQPRDGDPRSHYAVIDTGARRLTLHRVAYDSARTQSRMHAAGLPLYLADRLSAGR
jgi:predicted phosphodiesterase